MIRIAKKISFDLTEEEFLEILSRRSPEEMNEMLEKRGMQVKKIPAYTFLDNGKKLQSLSF